MKEIVCDTNIWYEVGKYLKEPDFLKDKSLIGTFHSIDELSRTPNLIKKPDFVRRAIQKLMSIPKLTLFEPPFKYLKRLDDPKYKYNPANELKSILQFTSLIANGHNVAEEKKEAFEKHVAYRKANLQQTADFFNEEAAKRKSNIKDKEKHRNENSIPLNRNLISLFVASSTKEGGLSDDFDWTKIELFESVLKVLFNEMEFGAITITANDWYDLFNMIYVTPSRLYWTNEDKWITLIKNAGMSKYLFNP